MDIFFQQIINLLTVPPGNLIYHLVIAFSIGSTLQANLSLSHDQNYPSTRRLTLGLVVLLIIQGILFLISGLAWQGVVNPQVLLPPIDRAANTFGVVWVFWLWGFPKPVRWADSIFILINLVVAVAMAFTLGLWSSETSSPFNNTYLDSGWELFSLVLALAGCAFLLVRRTSSWPVGLAMLVIMAAGNLIQLLVYTSGDFPGFVRLAQLAAFPLLYAISQRSLPALEPSIIVQPGLVTDGKTDKPLIKERRRYSADPKTVHAFLNLAVESNPKNMVLAVTRAIGQAMLSDLCMLTNIPDNAGQMVILGGYDLIREESLEGCTLARDDVPMLASSIEKGRALRLPSSHATSPDIKTLYEVIGLANPGNLLAVPLLNQSQTVMGGIVLLSPYSNRLWSQDDQNYLTNAAQQLTQILYRPLPASQGGSPVVDTNLTPELDRVKTELESSQQQVRQMEKAQKDLTDQLAAAQKRVAPAPQNDTFQALLEVQEESQDLILQLQAENERLRQAATQPAPVENQASGSDKPVQAGIESTSDLQHLEDELRRALADVALLQNKLAVSNARIIDLEKMAEEGTDGSSVLVPEQSTAIMMVIQELHRPVSSMLGQIDHMTQISSPENNETLAKSYDRLKASTERILGLLDDLMEIISTPDHSVELTSENIDVNSLMDLVISSTAVEFREKNLALQADLPDKIPTLNADPQATKKILTLLLQNASIVSPQGEVIRLKVRVQAETSDQPFLLFQVTDRGGGISSTDLPRLFSRFESTGNQPVAGLGEPKSVAEARDLVEAQGGRIWVDTDPGKSATFSFVLPLVQSRVVDDIGEE